MAVTPQIVILDISPLPNPGVCSIRVVFWFNQATGFPRPNVSSAYPKVAQVWPSQWASLQAGTLIEEVYTFTFPQSWIGSQWANVKNVIFSAWQDRNNWWLGIFPISMPAAGAKYEIYYDTTANAWSA